MDNELARIIMGEITIKPTNKRELVEFTRAPTSQVSDILERLLIEGKIVKDPRFYYRDATSYKYVPKIKKPMVKSSPDIEAMFEQIVVALKNLLEDTKNAVEEARRLRIENQNLVGKLVQINSLVCKTDE